jgi:hypothetical protein
MIAQGNALEISNQKSIYALKGHINWHIWSYAFLQFPDGLHVCVATRCFTQYMHTFSSRNLKLEAV